MQSSPGPRPFTVLGRLLDVRRSVPQSPLLRTPILATLNANPLQSAPGPRPFTLPGRLPGVRRAVPRPPLLRTPIFATLNSNPFAIFSRTSPFHCLGSPPRCPPLCPSISAPPNPNLCYPEFQSFAICSRTSPFHCRRSPPRCPPLCHSISAAPNSNPCLNSNLLLLCSRTRPFTLPGRLPGVRRSGTRSLLPRHPIFATLSPSFTLRSPAPPLDLRSSKPQPLQLCLRIALYSSESPFDIRHSAPQALLPRTLCFTLPGRLPVSAALPLNLHRSAPIPYLCPAQPALHYYAQIFPRDRL